MSSIKRAFEVLLIERRLPYSWDRRWQSLLYESALQDCLNRVFVTPPIPCSPDANCELHVQTSASDLAMAVLALKSLLRFDAGFAVVVHEDGTFTKECFNKLISHIPGCRCVSANDADETAARDGTVGSLRMKFLSRFDLLPGFEDRAKSRQQKVFDLHLASRRDTVIGLDSDTLFFQNPVEIVEWRNDETRPPFHARPEHPNLPIDQRVLNGVLPGIKAIDAFNSGLFGFRKQHIPLSLVAHVTGKVMVHRELPIYGDESVWRLIFGLIDHECLSFTDYPLLSSKREYLQLIKNSNLRYMHFLGKHRDGVYRVAALRVIDELRRL